MRLERLVIPFWLTILPFAILNLMFGFKDVTRVLCEYSIIAWFLGNGGWWYIAISMLLYILYPLLHKFAFNKMGGEIGVPFTNMLVIVVLFLFGNICVMHHFPNYYKEVEIGLPQISAFVLGVLAGFFAYKNYESKFWIPLAAIFVVLFHGLRGFYEPLYPYYLIVLRIFCIAVVCKIFDVGIFSFCNPILQWCGKYSLELYLIHLASYSLISKFQVDSIVLNHLNILLAFALCMPFNRLSNKVVKTLKLSKNRF